LHLTFTLVFFLIIPLLPRFTLFPYTTLFRSLTLKDQNAQELEEFKITMRVGLENLLHGWWREQGAKLTYAGRREAGVIGRRNETDRKSTRLNSSHGSISYAVVCVKKTKRCVD